MKIIQIEVGGFDNNFSYLIIGKNHESILIDPTGSAEKIEEEISKNRALVKGLFFTHSHPDHCELAEYFSKDKRVFFPKPGFSGEKEIIEFAGIKIELIHLPGHTADSAAYLIENNLFSGDTIFCKGVGTTAYGGNYKELENSLDYLFTLSENIILWPGHNYGGKACKLKEALDNSHIRPTEKVLEKIKKKVEEYESRLNKKVFFKK